MMRSVNMRFGDDGTDDSGDSTDSTTQNIVSGAVSSVTDAGTPTPLAPLPTPIPSGAPSPAADTSDTDDTAVATPAPYQADPNQQLSANYTVGSLCPTTQTLSQPNLPTDPSYVDNMEVLASVLELMNGTVGPFTVLSGYRTAELEAVLTSQGEPTAPGLSFHELGRAVDIYPTTMTIDQYWGQLLANSNTRDLFTEMAYKPSQNSIHLAVNVPADTRVTKVLALNATTMVYGVMSIDQIEEFIQPYLPNTTDA